MTQEKLRNEVREAFKSLVSVTASRALELPYLQACISEGLRIHSPSALGLPRTSPGASVDGVWVPKGVRKRAWSESLGRN